MPIVERQDIRQILAARHGMVVTLAEVIIGERLKQCDPALMQSSEENKRDLDGQPATISQLSPRSLVVGFDGWPFLGKGELEADVGIGVAVGEVMNELANSPAAVAIRCVELRIGKAGSHSFDPLRQHAQCLNICGAHACQGAGGCREAADGIAEIIEVRHGGSIGRIPALLETGKVSGHAGKLLVAVMEEVQMVFLLRLNLCVFRMHRFTLRIFSVDPLFLHILGMHGLTLGIFHMHCFSVGIFRVHRLGMLDGWALYGERRRGARSAQKQGEDEPWHGETVA